MSFKFSVKLPKRGIVIKSINDEWQVKKSVLICESVAIS